eukprot:TRINITY_DN71473_c0_g1_i1.p1 TRINITY_DN71473_c0_g1~~TRINITY_DN71473_c0_g1_i1.p1  ORF type:complete len:447 (-),score=123.87 TRINITY_DN71473_c0_g1_i1:144-1484(-)
MGKNRGTPRPSRGGSAASCAANGSLPAPSAASEDAEAARQFWGALGADEKLRILRFDDPEVVLRIFEVQQELQQCDLQCYALGVRDLDLLPERVGMNQFAMEADPDTPFKPAVFFAKDEFIERRDFDEFFERQLGAPFLNSRPLATKKGLSSFLEPAASSWPCFMMQVLRLLEAAIYAAFDSQRSRDRAASAECEAAAAEALAAAAAEALVADGEAGVATGNEGSGAKASKKKKKKAKARKATVVTDRITFEEPADADDDVAASGDEAACFRAVLPCCPEERTLSDDEVPLLSVSLAQHNYDTLSGIETASSSAGMDDDAASLSTVDTATVTMREGMVEGESHLKVDWNENGTPYLSTMEPQVELQVDWSERQAELRWSAWLSNGSTGAEAIWEWTATEMSRVRAQMKNTFVEVIESSDCESDEAPRSKSTPAHMRYRGREGSALF